MGMFRKAAEMARALCAVALASAVLPAAAQTAGAGAEWTPPGWERKAQLVGEKNETYLQSDDFEKRTRWRMPFLSFMIANTPGVGRENQALWAWLSFFRSCSDTRTMFNDLTTEFGDRARGQAAVDAVEQEFKTWAAAGQNRSIKIYAPLQLGRWDSTTQFFTIADRGYLLPVMPSFDVDFIDDNIHGLNGQIFGTSTGNMTIKEISTSTAPASCPNDGGGKGFTSAPRQFWSLYFQTFVRRAGSVGLDRNSDPKLPALAMTAAEAQAFVASFPKRRIMVEMEVAADPEIYPPQMALDGGTSQYAKHGRLLRVRYLDADGRVLVDQAYQ